MQAGGVSPPTSPMFYTPILWKNFSRCGTIPIKETSVQLWNKIKSFVRNDDPQTQIKWALYKRVWMECAQPYWKWIAVGIVCTIAAAAAEAFCVILVKDIVDTVGGENPQENINRLALIGLAVVAAFTVKGIFGYGKTFTMAKAGLLGITNLRRRLYKHMLTQPISFFHGTRTGTLTNYFTRMTDAVLALVTDNIITIVQSLASLLMMIGLMLWFAPQMTLVLVILAPCILIPLIIITRKRRILVRINYAADANAITHINQSILGIKTIQSFVTEEKESQNMNVIEDIRVKTHFKSALLVGLQSPLLEIMISIGLCIALIVGGYFIMNGAMTTGDFLVFLIALTAIYKPAKSITTIGGGIQAGLIAAENLFGFLDKKSELVETTNASALKRVPMTVKLEHVSFAYNEVDGNVLNDVSLTVYPGTICAFVGPSGGGKSTMFNLIDRFYDPQQGRVLINEIDVREFTLESLHRNIASVSQDVFLFNGTVADNIKYGTPDATQEQVESAAKAANAHGFIRDFPNQYDNEVGERGSLLSGGQKQRIAIARAILKDAPILLLDEATSALDSRAEQHIQEALKKLMRGRTTFVIAHRLATILEADIICVIKDGKIVEQGTDAELYALGREYKKLKDIQFSATEAGI